MNRSDIQARAQQVPFRGFALETSSGSWIDIEKPSDIYLPQERPDMVIVFDRGDRMVILDVSQILAVKLCEISER